MNIWEYNYLEYFLNIQNKKTILEKQLESYPEGWLVYQKNKGKGAVYLHTYNKGQRQIKHLSKTKDTDLIVQIEKRKLEAPQIKQQIKFYNRILKSNQPEIEKILSLSSLPEKDFLPTPSQNPKNPDYLNTKTKRGEMVRSKSERFIADALYSFNLDYRYEEKLKLGEIVIHPDFTIISPLNGKTYYWEHLGLADDPNYLADWFNRKELYGIHNIKEGKNLIVTTEKDKNRFDEIVKEYFTEDRYKKIRKKEKPSG